MRASKERKWRLFQSSRRKSKSLGSFWTQANAGERTTTPAQGDDVDMLVSRYPGTVGHRCFLYIEFAPALHLDVRRVFLLSLRSARGLQCPFSKSGVEC